MVDGLHKVLAEASLVTTTPILIHAVAAHRDAMHTPDRANAAHDLVAIAVGQTKSLTFQSLLLEAHVLLVPSPRFRPH